jgi:hypothetical protein
MAVLEICQINQQNSASRSRPYRVARSTQSKRKMNFYTFQVDYRVAIYMILSPPGIVVAL